MIPRFTVIALLALFLAGGCDRATTANANRSVASVPAATYDPESGKLTRLTHDTNGDGSIDSWVWMNGARMVRAEADGDADGRVDRWEYFDEESRLVKIGLSRAGDGREDAWAFEAPDGSLARLELRAADADRIARVERYEHGRIVSAESDEDGDGRPEKWEEYLDGRLALVALDTRRSGVPDRQLIYDPTGGVAVVDLSPPPGDDSRRLQGGR